VFEVQGLGASFVPAAGDEQGDGDDDPRLV
jgi:hypothetical protein